MEPTKRKEHVNNLESIPTSDQKKLKIEFEGPSQSEGASISSERITMTKAKLAQKITKAISDVIGDRPHNALINASKSGNLEVVKTLVEDLQVEINPAGTLNSWNPEKDPLWWAAKEGHLAVLQYLLEKGAHLEVRKFTWLIPDKHSGFKRPKGGNPKNERSPLFAAIAYGQMTILDFLLKHLIFQEIKLSKILLLDHALYTKDSCAEEMILKYDESLDKEDWDPETYEKKKNIVDVIRKKDLKTLNELLKSRNVIQTSDFDPITIAMEDKWFKGSALMSQYLDDSHVVRII